MDSSEINDIMIFLKRFKNSDNIKEVFTCGCCYWFAAILFSRFNRDGATIMYDEIANHFGTKVRDRVYDITGDVTDSYQWVVWESITDSALRTRITRDCIMF